MCLWNDGRFTNWGRPDPEVAGHFLARLAADLDAAEREGDDVVAVVHHVPFEELVPRRDDVRWSFLRAFAGSRATGERLLRARRLRHVLCGHIHKPQRLMMGPVEVRDVSFTPASPEPVVVELAGRGEALGAMSQRVLGS